MAALREAAPCAIGAGGRPGRRGCACLHASAAIPGLRAGRPEERRRLAPAGRYRCPSILLRNARRLRRQAQALRMCRVRPATVRRPQLEGLARRCPGGWMHQPDPRAEPWRQVRGAARPPGGGPARRKRGVGGARPAPALSRNPAAAQAERGRTLAGPLARREMRDGGFGSAFRPAHPRLTGLSPAAGPGSRQRGPDGEREGAGRDSAASGPRTALVLARTGRCRTVVWTCIAALAWPRAGLWNRGRSHRSSPGTGGDRPPAGRRPRLASRARGAGEAPRGTGPGRPPGRAAAGRPARLPGPVAARAHAGGARPAAAGPETRGPPPRADGA